MSLGDAILRIGQEAWAGLLLVHNAWQVSFIRGISIGQACLAWAHQQNYFEMFILPNGVLFISEPFLERLF